MRKILLFGLVLALLANFSGAICNELRGWGITRSKIAGEPPRWDGGFELLDYNAYYLGDISEKVVYLTFDEGYEAGYTTVILDVLRDKQVPAAFFVTKSYIEEHGDLIARMVNEGHIVGNHTIRHKSSPSLSDAEFRAELAGVADYFKQTFGQEMPRFFRPPMGEYSLRTLRLAQDEGYATIFWSFAYVDWRRDKQPGADYALKRVADNLHNGAILLLHAVSSSNAEAMADIIDTARAAGYEFKCLEHLIDNFGGGIL
ncbi:MAG: polysaccharide deacetylase family protein [Clostridiales bacterium]|jgi:peptidoglycan-N-acetylmuramic acid deacetylase|nr:polysaccharide deacetylase family protein [Clostridiales bacterium]